MIPTKPRAKRQYEELYLRIKAAPNTVIKLHAPPLLHNRVAKAIRKERGIYGLKWRENDCYRLKFWSEGSVLCVKFEALAGATALQELKSIDLSHLMPTFKESYE